MMNRGLRAMLFAACILTVWAASAHAQAIGSIFGKVTDSSGGVLPGVTVTVTGPTLQRPLVAVTSESGTYQFPSVPLGTFTVTFELSSFKKAVRPNIVITNGFNAGVDQKMEIGQMSEEVTISAAAPVVDTKKVSTGAVFTAEVLEKIPTARDPWQIINMTPGVQAGLNVGGSASGQQVGLSSRGTSANVQWNLEGGSITDLSSNSSPSYFNFDSFEQIQVVNGGGDVSVQSSGLSINLVTKSGSNVFKGSSVFTFENDAMQGQNVSREQFDAGANGFLSGNPLQKIDVFSAEYGGPIVKNKLWFWGAGDRQDINGGVTNFFDASKGDLCQALIAAQKAGSTALKNFVTYDKLDDVTKCLTNDRTLIKDLQWKVNYQLNAANKFQYLFQSDNKYRNHRGASATTQAEATTQQTSDKPWGFPLPTHSLTHTLILSDKLVFNNQFTYVHGGFFLDYQDVPPQGDCLQSRYLGNTDYNDYLTGSRANASCLFSTQTLSNQTTGIRSRSLVGSYQTNRHSWEAKTDGTYFLTNTLGGDHSLKFGLGWRRNPIQSFTHYSAGAAASVQCVGNNNANCSNTFVAPGSATGLVARAAVLYRDQLRNNEWWTYNGYIQDSYSRGKLRLNGGLRYDWQQSKYLGGCVPFNPVAPDLLPAQCEGETQTDAINGRKIQPFSNWSPRLSATYDLFGNGKTSIHANGSYYYSTKITLADSLGGLFTQTALTWGNNQTNGNCSTTAGAPCWQDFNLDGLITRNELIGTGTSSSSRFVNGVLVPAGNIVDPSAQIGRTREAVVGIQHEVISNLAVGVDFIYRKYDRGTTTYTIGYEPGGPNFPLSAIYVPAAGGYTDPITGINAPYYVVCDGCARPSGLGSITLTNPNYQVYKGVDITATKRFSNRWQMATSLTIQDNPQYFPFPQTAQFINPTGLEYQNGVSTIAKYLYKAQGSYQFPWDITVSGNFNANQGGTRTVQINGPGSVYGGTTGTITYNTLRYQGDQTVRFDAVKLLDMGVTKAFVFRGGRNRLKLTLDGFNLFNVSTIQGYVSNTISNTTGFVQPNSIVPPRVFRVGTAITF